MPLGTSAEAKRYWVYITANVPRGVLYVGMSSDLPARAWQHRERVLQGFTQKYGVDRLVYFEEHADAAVAARRERAMKRWRRDWKIELVEKNNRTWRDLFDDVVRGWLLALDQGRDPGSTLLRCAHCFARERS